MYKRVWIVRYRTGIKYFYATETALKVYLVYDHEAISYFAADKEDLKYQDKHDICSQDL